MPILKRLSLLAWLCAASFTSLGQAAEKSSDNKKADAAFWNSVYAENHVLDVQISLTPRGVGSDAASSDANVVPARTVLG